MLHVLCVACSSPANPQPPYGVFGSKYIMEIPDTVVEGHQGFTEGSEEYMVFEKVLLGRAAHHGLYPVSAAELWAFWTEAWQAMACWAGACGERPAKQGHV